MEKLRPEHPATVPAAVFICARGDFVQTDNLSDDAVQLPNTADNYSITFTELAAKNAKFVGKGIYKKTGQIADYPQVKHWRQKRVTVVDIGELARYLESVAYPKPGFSVCLIHGEAGPGVKDSILRRKTQHPSDNLFRDTPSRFVVFDIDGAELGDGFDWTADPKAAVHSIVERLGEPFVRCSYVAMLSGTHGLKKDSKGFWTGEFDHTKVKFKLFVVADRGVDTVELKTWSIMLKAALTAVDPSQSSSAVQPIYVARPMVYGGDGKDVLAQFNIPVVWLHRGEIDSVPPPTELKREVRFNRAEGTLDTVAPHPNADAALRAVGKPSKNASDIYAHLRAAAQHLAREQEIDLADKQAVAEAATRIINTLRERVSEFREQIIENLERSGRGWDEIEGYLADSGDVYRWILWCFDHPGSLKPKRKTIERLKVEPRPQLPPPQPGLLERIRQQLKDEVAQFIDIVTKAYEGGGFTATENGPAPYRPPQRLLSFPIGAGKSTESRTAGVSFVDRFVEGATVVYALPRHQLGDEQVAALAREHPGVRAAVWRGMEAVDPHYPPDLHDPLAPRKTMCWRTDDVLDMRDACLSATDLCQQGRGEDARRCAFFDECGYQRQKGQKGAQVWFMAHEMLVHEKPKALGSPVLLFIDENPIDAFLVGVEAEFSVPLGALTKGKPISKRAVEARDGADGDEAELGFWNAELYRVLSELPDGPVPRSVMEFLTPERCARMYTLQWRDKVEVEIDLRWTGDRLKAALVPAANNKTVKKLAALWKTLGEALKPGGPALMGRVRLGWCSITNTRKVFLCGVQGPCEPWDKVPTIVMDATGSIEMLQTVWPDMTERRCTEEIVTPFVAIEQVVDRVFGKHYCAPERPNAIDNENAGDAAKAKLAIEVYGSVMAQAIRYGCGDAGLITYLKTELCIRNNCVVPPWLSLTHYGCESGTNSLEKVRMLALVGRPLPQYSDVVRRAEALFAEAIVWGGTGLRPGDRYDPHQGGCSRQERDRGEAVASRPPERGKGP